ncbi:MAG: four helix bundle protein [Akkermansia sp.]|nr:four helix bundle protein [Akkermansia sp.]
MSARTRSFALQVLRLCGELHGDYVVEHVGKQLLRAASSLAANFRAACHAKSSPDCFSKLKMCEEKSVVACFWLEANEIAAIISASCVTARARLKK